MSFDLAQIGVPTIGQSRTGCKTDFIDRIPPPQVFRHGKPLVTKDLTLPVPPFSPFTRLVKTACRPHTRTSSRTQQERVER